MFTVNDYNSKRQTPSEFAENALITSFVLNAVYSAFPSEYFRFNSGWRSAAHNKAVGGGSRSFHLKALAADITPLNSDYSSSTQNKIGSIVAQFGFELITEKHKNHYHIEPSPSFNRAKVLAMMNAGSSSLAQIGGATAFGILIIALAFLYNERNQ